MSPTRFDSSIAPDIAQAMLDGFHRHYQLFQSESARAKARFEARDWHGQQRAQRERIEFYDRRVLDALGVAANEKIAGFVHIGRPAKPPEERDRPKLDALVTRYRP